MKIIKKESAQNYSGDGYAGMDYKTTDKDINFAIIKINGRSPKTGYQLNEECKELLYIMKGNGILYLKEKQKEIEFNQKDVIIIDKKEAYAFDGDFEAAVPCTPAWEENQHKYIDN